MQATRRIPQPRPPGTIAHSSEPSPHLGETMRVRSTPTLALASKPHVPRRPLHRLGAAQHSSAGEWEAAGTRTDTRSLTKMVTRARRRRRQIAANTTLRPLPRTPCPPSDGHGRSQHPKQRGDRQNGSRRSADRNRGSAKRTRPSARATRLVWRSPLVANRTCFVQLVLPQRRWTRGVRSICLSSC